MKQVLSDIDKIKNKLSEELRREIIKTEENIKNLIDKEIEAEELRKELVDIEYKLYQIEERASEELQDEIFRIRRKVAKVIVTLNFIL